MKSDIRKRVEALRQVMRQEGVSAFIVPTTDPHSSEYVAPHWECRKWITGFNGSYGTAVITLDDAGLWTDSRYFIQAGLQLEGSGIKLFKEKIPGTPGRIEWLKSVLKEGDCIGINGWVNNWALKEEIEEVCGEKNIKLKLIDDPFDKIWEDRPSIPMDSVVLHDLKWAGKPTSEKIAQIRAEMKANGCDSLLLAALDDIAWTLNLRGNDVHCVPVFISYLYIGPKRITLYINKEKITPDVELYLKNEGVEIKPYEAVQDDIKNAEGTLQISPNLNLALTMTAMKDAKAIKRIAPPTDVLKTIKNDVEIRGFRRAMEKDGVAMVKFLIWLEKAVPKGGQTELSVDEVLGKLRCEQPDSRGVSFDSIAAYADHAASPHYHSTPESNCELLPKGLFLLDSGGHYLDGTTDITRTIPLGPTTEEERIDYTLDLKGHLQVQNAVFPYGTNGTQIDALARLPMWKYGINYLHGTGHGVGEYLSVHEGPHQMRMNYMPTVLEPGMTLTVEPAIYKPGRHGVRHENTLLIVPAMETADGKFLKFEPLTLCPIHKAPIIVEMLTPEELEWFNEYHAMVYDRLSPYLNEEEKAWLKDATSPLTR